MRLERGLLGQGHDIVAGCDEVGRGSLGGPVTVGIVVVDASTPRQPAGLRDSKLLTPAERRSLVPRVGRWCVSSGVGHASAAEIDELGILRALRLAGERALVALPIAPSVVILDGTYDWFTRSPRSARSPLEALPKIELEVRGDLTCASVAAASVLAKVARDDIMVELAAVYDGYDWERNKGYASASHLAALRERGPCEEHRRSWRLAGTTPEQLVLLEEPVGTPA